MREIEITLMNSIASPEPQKTKRERRRKRASSVHRYGKESTNEHRRQLRPRRIRPVR